MAAIRSIIKVFLNMWLACICSLAHLAYASSEAIVMDIRLMAADLVDELVYSWIKDPPFPEKKGLILAEITAPLALDERFSILVENRLYELLRLNPQLPVELQHCGLCRNFVAKSTPEGTVISRGIDQPEVLSNLMTTNPNRLGLSLNFEAEGRELVLRAYLFELQGQQPIIWAKAFSTSTSAPRALREAAPLISLEAARDMQRQLLAGRDPFELSSRITVRQFSSSGAFSLPPLVFFEQSIESLTLPRRNLRAALTLGVTSIPDSMMAWSAGGHVAWLLFAREPHLFRPDYYWFIGGHYLRMRGPDAALYGSSEFDINQLINSDSEPKATLTSWRTGFEVHIKHRLGVMIFLEDLPLLKKNKNFERNQLLGIPYVALGGGLVIRW